MKRACVLGGCGFVGRHFVRRLLAEGWYVQVVDNLLTGVDPWDWDPRPNPKTRLNFARADVRSWMAGHPMDDFAAYEIIIHCAAVVGGRLKIDGDPLAVATDLAIDSDFFNWVVKAKNKPKIIYFSSSAVYPVELQSYVNRAKLQEAFAGRFELSKLGIPDMSYGWSKLTGEYLAQLAVKQYGADIVIYRPFSGYGEDQSFDYPFPSIIRRVVNKENPIQIWGSGDQCRDFIHIDDIVEVVMQTKDVLKPGEVLNLGSGIPCSFKQLVILAAREVGIPIGTVMAGQPLGIECDTTKPEGVFYRVADTYKLDQFYKPKVSLEEGIRRVVAHLSASRRT